MQQRSGSLCHRFSRARPRQDTYGAPPDPTLLAAGLAALLLAMVLLLIVVRPLARTGLFLRATVAALAAFIMAATLFLLLSATISGVTIAVSFVQVR